MFRRFAVKAALFGLVACAGGEEVNDDAGVDAGIDTGVVVFDTGVPIDTGVPPIDAGFPDTGPPPPPPPPNEVAVSGRIIRLGDYLGGNDNAYVTQASIIAYGVQPPAVTTSAEVPAGNYQLVLPANGQALMVTQKAGYNQTFYSITTQAQPYPNRNLYIAQAGWVASIAAAHGVDLNAQRPCQTPSLAEQNLNCLYAAVVGRILDDGTVGQGVIRPVAGVSADDFSIYGPGNESWYRRGPYFLDYTAEPNAEADTSIVFNDNGNYRGGLYVTFVEVPSRGPLSVGLEISVTYPSQGINRYFGPINVQVFRSPGGSVLLADLPELGAPPEPLPVNVDFDTQVYPLFLSVAEGGLGCVGCHTNQGGAEPAGGMNLYGGPAAAYASLDPAQYPARVNVDNPGQSLLLVRPLYEQVGNQDHPIFAFITNEDPGYQLIYRWIDEDEGQRNNNNLPPVSFYNDIRPLLYEPTGNGGAGCYACHVNGADADNAPGGLYMGGDGDQLYEALVNTAPNNPGPYDEQYRINKNDYPERSLLLTNPLFGDAEPHPVKIFDNAADSRYQLIYRWIAEGYNNDTP